MRRLRALRFGADFSMLSSMFVAPNCPYSPQTTGSSWIGTTCYAAGKRQLAVAFVLLRVWVVVAALALAAPAALAFFVYKCSNKILPV